MALRWRGVVAIQGEETREVPRRLVDRWSWRELPATLRLVTEDFGGHEGAQPVARIDTLELLDDGKRIWGDGGFSESPGGQLAAQWIEEKVLRGVSADGGSEVPVIEEVVNSVTGEVVPVETLMAVRTRMEEASLAGDGDELARLDAWMAGHYQRLRYPSAVVNAATLVAIPAFDGCVLEVYDDAEEPAQQVASAWDRFVSFQADRVASTTALVGEIKFLPSSTRQAAAPAKLRADWFQPQQLTRPTKWTISDDGRMSGHLFTWGACHRSWPISCEPPERQRDFADFHTGEVCLDDGTRLRTGVITFADLHAPDLASASPEELARLMEHTGVQLGPVRLHPDQHGLQACGQVFDDVPPTEAARALAGYPSGDWRRVGGGGWRLFGLHIVNTPGYPSYEAGEDARLVASMARPADGVPPFASGGTHARTLAPALPLVLEAPCGCLTHGDSPEALSGDPGGCSCGTKPALSASALADLAGLDLAMARRVKRRRMMADTG